MFKKEIIKEIANNHAQVFRSLRNIESSLLERFWELDDPILALILSVACNEPLLLIGKPGTAKSRLIRAFCEIVGLIDDQNNARNGPLVSYLIQQDRSDPDAGGYFEYLLTPFTEPNELFGFYDIQRLIAPERSDHEGGLRRIEKEMIHKAYVVYLDEVFNASSAILNSLLAFLNERMFHDRGERKPVLYKALFAATNHAPETGELAAVFDRFLLRCRVENTRADPGAIKSLLELGWYETYGRGPSENSGANTTTERKLPGNDDWRKYRNLFQSLKELRDTLRDNSLNKNLFPEPPLGAQPDKNFYSRLVTNISIARTGGFSDMSNRRIVKMLYVMLIHCMYRSINGLGDSGSEFILGNPELELMEKFFYDRAYDIHVLK